MLGIYIDIQENGGNIVVRERIGYEMIEAEFIYICDYCEVEYRFDPIECRSRTFLFVQDEPDGWEWTSDGKLVCYDCLLRDWDNV